MLGLNLEWVHKWFGLSFFLPLDDTFGNVLCCWVVASHFYVASLEIWLNVVYCIIMLKGFENLIWLSFQNLDLFFYWSRLAEFYCVKNPLAQGFLIFIGIQKTVMVSRTLGINFIYKMVMINVSLIFNINIL